MIDAKYTVTLYMVNLCSRHPTYKNKQTKEPQNNDLRRRIFQRKYWQNSVKKELC